MTTTALAPLKRTTLEQVLSLALGTVSNPDTERHYRLALTEFLDWGAGGTIPFSRAAVYAWRGELEGRGLAAATINQRLAAIRKLAREAHLNGLLDAETSAAIGQVPNVRQTGQRSGNWLSLDQAQSLIEAPDPATLQGLRDRAALSLLVGCALRRSEAAALTVEHIQERDGRWVILDLIGKRGRIRTVPVPAWVMDALADWASAAGIQEGRMLRSLDHGRIGAGLTGRALFDVASRYGAQIGVQLKAHDLRRTCAKLSRAGGGQLEQIQMLLGHSSIQTTERYLGTQQNLRDAPNDRLGLGWDEHNR
jgi:integrase